MSDGYIPTTELRYERRLDIVGGDTHDVLQQQFEEIRDPRLNWMTPPGYEWRDVPVVDEE